MRTRQPMTISLPPEMVEQFEKLRKIEHRSRSELVREALRQYFARQFPVAELSAAELRALRRGRKEHERGDYVTLDQLIREFNPRSRSISKKTA